MFDGIIQLGYVALGFAVYPLIVLGYVYLLGHSRASRPFRDAIANATLPNGRQPLVILVEMVECPACLSAWVGLGSGAALWYAFSGALSVGQGIALTIAVACYTVGATLLLATKTKLMNLEKDD